MRFIATLISCWAVLLAVPLAAQQPPAQPKMVLPKIHFTFDYPDMPLKHYEIEVDLNGVAHYESQHSDGPDDGIIRDFEISAATRDRVFMLAKAANRLHGEFNFTKHRIAFNGNKTISLIDEQGTNTAKFVWSENQNVTDLAEVFEGISATLEEDPILRRLRKYDPLGLNAELVKVEKQADSGFLRELNLMTDILKEISADSSIMGLARKRADHLLKLASDPGPRAS